MSQQEFKPGDRVRVFGSEYRIVCREQVWKVADENGSVSYAADCDVVAVPADQPITDAERVAACRYAGFTGLSRRPRGRWVVMAIGFDSKDCTTVTEALDAWVRHLRSTGWEYKSEGQS